MLVAGYPCVSLSSLNTNPQAFQNPDCPTGAGFTSVMGVIAKLRPQLVALENVRQMLQSRQADKGRKPIEIQNKQMTLLGYQCSYVLANTCEYGLPQSRNRVWAMYIRADKAKGTPSMVEENFKFLGFDLTPSACVVSGPPTNCL